MKQRSFIAVDIPLEVGKRLATLAAGMRCSAAKPVRHDQMHITLLFLGDLDKSLIEGVSEAISRIDTRQFNVVINGIGVLGARGPGVVYARVIGGVSELSRVSAALKESISELGIKTEGRSFLPHVTIARVRNPSMEDAAYINGFAASHSEDSLGEFVCSEIKLEGSSLGSNGPSYSGIYVKRLAPI